MDDDGNNGDNARRFQWVDRTRWPSKGHTGRRHGFSRFSRQFANALAVWTLSTEMEWSHLRVLFIPNATKRKWRSITESHSVPLVSLSGINTEGLARNNYLKRRGAWLSSFVCSLTMSVAFLHSSDYYRKASWCSSSRYFISSMLMRDPREFLTRASRIK